MALEVSINATLSYSDSEDGEGNLQVTDLQRTVASKKYIKTKQSIDTSEEVINLGEVTSLAEIMIVNRSLIYTVNIKSGTGGVIVASLLPGKMCLIPLGSGMQAPFAIALIGAVTIEYLLISA